MSKFKRIKVPEIKKADAIFSADWHIRPDTPVCRTDNFFEAMEKKINFILALSDMNDCPILVAGDIGDKPQWPNWLLEWAIKELEACNVICIPGQHDLPNHRLDLWEKSGIGVLYAAGAIKLIQYPKIINDKFAIFPFPYGQKIAHAEKNDNGILMIAMTHQMVIENKPLWPGQEAPKGNALLRKFPEYDLILSGDNHSPFVSEYEGRLLINPGSLMRNTAAQINYKPRVYLWYAKENRVEVVYLPIEKGVISREHVDVTKQRNKRMDAYLERMKQDIEIRLSYPKNMEEYLKKFRTQLSIKNKIWEAVV